MHVKPYLIAATFLAFTGVNHTAHAGFEWIPPAHNPSAIPAPSDPIMLTPTDMDLAQAKYKEMAPLKPYQAPEPVPAEPAPAPLAPIPEQIEAPKETIMTPAPESVATAPAPAPITSYEPLAAPEKKPVIGFGNNLPLAMALIQVLPKGYTYSFSHGSYPGVLVSWRGGRAWDVVLHEMLASVGLKGTIDGKVVRIRPVEQSKNFLDRTPDFSDFKVTPKKGPFTQNSSLMQLRTIDMASPSQLAQAMQGVQPAAGVEASTNDADSYEANF